jgi:hypothetical protein
VYGVRRASLHLQADAKIGHYLRGGRRLSESFSVVLFGCSVLFCLHRLARRLKLWNLLRLQAYRDQCESWNAPGLSEVIQEQPRCGSVPCNRSHLAHRATPLEIDYVLPHRIRVKEN